MAGMTVRGLGVLGEGATGIVDIVGGFMPINELLLADSFSIPPFEIPFVSPVRAKGTIPVTNY